MTAPKGHDISGPDNELLQRAFEDYGRYLVGLGFLQQSVSPDDDLTRACFCPGFIMQFGRKWYWTTAGHVIEDILRATEERKVRFSSFRLLDYYGSASNSVHEIPFDFWGAWRYFVFDKEAGLDFAVVALREHDQKLLKANGIIPVRPPDWQNLARRRYQGYFILGFPEDATQRTKSRLPGAYEVTGRPTPSGVYVQRMSRPPRKLLRTRFRRFIGKVGPDAAIGSIAGMSGGPIFGIPKGYKKHRVVALQSTWDRRARINCACPLDVFAPLVQKQLRSSVQRRGSPSSC